MTLKIISGGQTGVDRAALDAAMAMGLEVGGWCPKGRRSEEGPIPPQYPLRETDGSDYRSRTEKNVMDSDGTLVLYMHRLSGGTRLTRDLAAQQRRPFLEVQLVTSPTEREQRQRQIVNWCQQHQIKLLNIAGPRGSHHPQIYALARDYVEALLSLFLGDE